MTQGTIFDRPPIGDHPFDYADNSTPAEPPPEPKRRRAWFPEVADHEWIGIPDMPRVVGIDQEYDFEVVSFDGTAEQYRQHLAKMIIDGATTHARLVYIGKMNGWDGVRLGTCRPDHGEVLAKAIDAALRYNERQFLLLVRQHFTKERSE